MQTAALDRAFVAAWPAAEVEEADGWLLRATGGTTRRANSALVLDVPDDLDARLADVVAWYRRRGLVPRLQLGPVALGLGLAAAIGARGWTLGDGACGVLTRPLAGIEPAPPDVHVEAAATRSDEWLDTWWTVSPRDGTGARGHVEGVLDRVAAPARFLLGRTEDGAAAACALGVVAGDVLVIESVATLPDRRRRGAATALIADALGWAAARGAREAAVAVERGNDGAHAFFERLGFVETTGWTYATPV